MGTPLRDYLARHPEISQVDLLERIKARTGTEIAYRYLNCLVRGVSRPSVDLMLDIELATNGEIKAETWIEEERKRREFDRQLEADRKRAAKKQPPPRRLAVAADPR